MDDDDLWGPPLVVQDDTFRKQTLRGCEFWFDCRTDVLEENFLNERFCEQVLVILNKKKQDAEIGELDKDSASLQNHVASSASGDSRGLGSSDSDKTLSASLPDAETSSARSALDEDGNTSSISDAQTIETRDSSNDAQDMDPETRLKTRETAPNDPLTVEVADTSSSPVSLSKIEEAEEHSCSSLVTDHVFDPIKQAPENKSFSAISRENIGGSTLALETREKVRKNANATNEDGQILKDHQQSDSLQDIVTASEPFTTESLLEMCDEPEIGRQNPCDEGSKRSNPEVVKATVKDDLIINLFTEARQKEESNALLNPGSVLIKKRRSNPNSSDDKGMITSLIRNSKQKVGGKPGEINIDPVKNSTQSTPIIIRGSSVPTQHTDSTLDFIERIRQSGGNTMSESVTSISDLKKKTGKELKSIAKELKLTRYYKLKKEDLLQQLITQLKPQLTDCTKQIMES